MIKFSVIISELCSLDSLLVGGFIYKQGDVKVLGLKINS